VGTTMFNLPRGYAASEKPSIGKFVRYANTSRSRPTTGFTGP
jgi:hypothetical protein